MRGLLVTALAAAAMGGGVMGQLALAPSRTVYRAPPPRGGRGTKAYQRAALKLRRRKAAR